MIDEHVTAKKASGDKTADVIERRLKEVLEKLGDIEATDFPASKIEQLKLDLTVGPRTEKRKETRKPASINRFLQDLKAVLNRALKARKLVHNPFDSVELLTENNERARELTPEEAKALWAGVPDRPPALRPYFEFLQETGARAAEATGPDLAENSVARPIGGAARHESGKEAMPCAQHEGHGDFAEPSSRLGLGVLLAGWPSPDRRLHHPRLPRYLPRGDH